MNPCTQIPYPHRFRTALAEKQLQVEFTNDEDTHHPASPAIPHVPEAASQAAQELCALGFEAYWVNQALELTNHNQEYALEWLLSDEFKLARQQFNEQRKKFKAYEGTESG